PSARATPVTVSAANATHSTTTVVGRLANRVHREEDDDDDRGNTRRECNQCQDEVERHDRARWRAHPFALSSSPTVNGAAPAGRMSNVRPRWPAITGAGAGRP